MKRPDSRSYPKSGYQFGGLVQPAHHEQSETVQDDQGRWINVYGAKTPQAGRRLPDTPDYDTVDDAVEAAKKRSREHLE